MNKCFAILLSLVLTACKPAPSSTPPLTGARIGGPFALTDQDGRTVTDRDFAGLYRIVYFGYTFCPDVCPTDTANLMRGWQAFEKADAARGAKIRSIFITIDPERDTPAVLKTFTAAFDPRLVGLTGSPQAIAAVAKGYGVTYAAQKSADPTAYLVDHSRAAYLMDPDGKPLALLPQDETPQAVAAELDKWVK